MTTAMAVELVDLEDGVIDVVSVRERIRLLTRSFDQRDAAGRLVYGGLRYVSRMETRFESRAVFGGAEFRETKTSPIVNRTGILGDSGLSQSGSNSTKGPR